MCVFILAVMEEGEEGEVQNFDWFLEAIFEFDLYFVLFRNGATIQFWSAKLEDELQWRIGDVESLMAVGSDSDEYAQVTHIIIYLKMYDSF